MDVARKTRFWKRSVLRNLPEKVIKTRSKSAYKLKDKVFDSNKAEFPIPIKLEDDEAPIKIPKPKMIKTELNLNTENAQLYLRHKFQPIVRVKRLKNEELLFPFKTRYHRTTRQFKATNDFYIQKVYSLNPRIRLKRLKIDCDHSYNEKSLLNSSLGTSGDNSNYVQNESFAELEFKYSTPEQSFSLFESYTPHRSSILSNPADSGVSSSTPSMSLHNCLGEQFYLGEMLENRNSFPSNTQSSIDCIERTSTTTPLDYQPSNSNTLLLEIAAERAFINNHLMHFGYSPIQFNLFNKLSELTIFLKFLMGNLN